MTVDDATRAVEAVWRIESARLIAGLTGLVGDVGVAEDLAQDALEAALRQWPAEGVPPKPGAWLMSTAKHRAIDQLRRQTNLHRKTQQLGQYALVEEELSATDMDAAADDWIGDDLLRLMFICCHPLLSVEARAALTLRLLGGLTTDEIARAFLVPEPTIAQRITRAKKTLSAANVPFEVPQGGDFIDRSRRCWASSTSSSTRATRRPPASNWSGRNCSKKHFDLAGSWPGSCQMNLRPTGWSR